MDYNVIYNDNCIDFMKRGGVTDKYNLTLTDIPYGKVNRKSNGIRSFDKKIADVETFSLDIFLNGVYSVTTGTIIIFCDHSQVSPIYNFFFEKSQSDGGTVRQLIWHKSNPSPVNGQHVYLSGIENAVWFKKPGGTFNGHCKNTVFKYPCGRSKLHPTEKNHELLRELIRDNSNPGDVVFDPCAGSGAHLLVAKEEGRRYVGIELNPDYYNIALNRLQEAA